MRRCITEVKALLAGESVEYSGMTNRLDFAGSDGGAGVPVLMAASGPRSLQLAGEVADGALALVGYTPGIVATALEHLDTGARRSGRTLDDLDIMFAVRTCIADSVDEARRLARPVSVHWGLMWADPTGSPIPVMTYRNTRYPRRCTTSIRTWATPPTGRKPLT